MNKPAKVYLVGAGPGDPGLITVRGGECLRRAELVLFDYLVNPQLLDYAPPQAERICLGRHGQGKLWNQEEINRHMVSAALQGRVVVRLKGGDPAVFGHLSEEIEALVEAGLEFEIVPGITAALAASSYAGLPMTDRRLASAVALVTGHETDKTEEMLDYLALAVFPGTLVFYMGVTSAPRWTSSLIAAGKPPDTPAMIVRRCSWPNQFSASCRLDEVASLLDQTRPHRIRPPALVIVGPVAQREAAWSWFTRRPLFGQTILVTRAADQASALAAPLAELGAEVLFQPAISISAPADWSPVDAAIGRLKEFYWLVFSSSNGVQAFLQRVMQHADLRQLAGCKLAAIGPGTAAELGRWNLKADLVPETFVAEALLQALKTQLPPNQPARCLLLRASRGREVLAEGLREAGAEVEQVVVYSSTDIATPDADILAALTEKRIQWITVTSSAIARSLVQLFGPHLNHAQLASISPVTSSTLRELGFTPAVEAKAYTMPGLIAAIQQACQAESQP